MLFCICYLCILNIANVIQLKLNSERRDVVQVEVSENSRTGQMGSYFYSPFLCTRTFKAMVTSCSFSLPSGLRVLTGQPVDTQDFLHVLCEESQHSGHCVWLHSGLGEPTVCVPFQPLKFKWLLANFLFIIHLHAFKDKNKVINQKQLCCLAYFWPFCK